MMCPQRLHTHDIAEAAQMIGATPRWLTMRCRYNGYPGRKINRCWRFTDDDIAAIIELCRATPPSERSEIPTPTLRSRRRHTG